MSGRDPNLGICFSGKQLYFAINDTETPNRLTRIGCFDFNFNVAKTIRTQDKEHFSGIYDLIGRLKKQFPFQQIKMLTTPDHECWTSVPKLVYDQSDEREAHLKVIMKGIERQNIEPIWYELSNRDYKFLNIRNKPTMAGYERLSEHAQTADFCSDFEIGAKWVKHSGAKGSFLTLACYPGLLSVSSYMLGKLRAATYLQFEDFGDLPYLWLHFSQNLKWMNGLYDEILAYGVKSYKVIDALTSVWNEPPNIRKMDTLETMLVEADETTYSFSLESAFPAIMLALDL